MNDDLQQQDSADEAAARDFMERSVMCAEVTLPGVTARAISRYISNLEVESDNDLAEVQALSKDLMATSEALVKQNNILKNTLKRVYEMCNGLPARQYVADFVSKNWPATGDPACLPNVEVNRAKPGKDEV